MDKFKKQQQENTYIPGVTNCIHNVQMYANVFVVYTKLLEAVPNFVCKYNILLLSFILFLSSPLVENYFVFLILIF